MSENPHLTLSDREVVRNQAKIIDVLYGTLAEMRALVDADDPEPERFNVTDGIARRRIEWIKWAERESFRASLRAILDRTQKGTR